MARIKERRKFIHEPSTHEIFYCLCGMPAYSKILLEESTNKPYTDFLRWLIEKNFYNERTEKITIKKIAADFKTDAAKATKWFREIYDEIFELSDVNPALFQTNGVKVAMRIKYGDSYCWFNTSLPVLPREFESINFPFVKGKMGTDKFWVKQVEHEIENDLATINLSLEGGTLNKYREFALDKALFHGWIHFMEVYQKQPYELDDDLKRIFRK